MSFESYVEHIRLQATTPLDWRWRWAHKFLAEPPRKRNWPEDPATCAAFVYLADFEIEGTISRRSRPVSQAHEIFRKNESIRWKLEALVLARESDEAIAGRLNLDHQVVAFYVALFFDVRPRLQYWGWMLGLFGFSPQLGFAADDLATLWAWIAYHRGVVALELAIAVTTGEGRENYSEEALDSAALFIEMARIPLDRKPEQMIQLNLRNRVEVAGLPASASHRLRRRQESGQKQAVSRQPSGGPKPL